MELEYLRKIHQNKTGYYELAVPPQVVKALGTCWLWDLALSGIKRPNGYNRNPGECCRERPRLRDGGSSGDEGS